MCREMKDSGVQWISTIPESWEIKNIKSLLIERKEVNNPIKTDFILSLTKERGVIPYSEKGDVGNKSKEDYTGYKLAYPKDIVLNSMNIIIGSVGISNYFGAVSPVYYMLYPRKEGDYVEYFNYVFQTREFQNNLKGYGNGIMEHRMRIQMNKLNTVLLPYPPVKTQNKIVNYLDKKVSQIDDIISKQKGIIEKYKADKQSIITETVTKGLNKNVPMKDSGIEWIGEIPSHWSKEKIKYLVQISRGRFNHRPRNDVRFYNGEYPFIQTGDVARANKYINTYEQTLNKKGFEVSKEFKKGTIVMTIAANIGDIAILNFDSCAPDSIVGFEPIGYSHWNYIYYLFIAAKPAFFETSIISTQLNLNIELIKELFVVRPPMEEQKQIAEFLDKKCIAIDTAVVKKEQLIEKLESYKKSLIYECVTGKREVN